jgi:hypothetical protein
MHNHMTQKIDKRKKKLKTADYDNFSSNSESSKEPMKKKRFNRLIQTIVMRRTANKKIEQQRDNDNSKSNSDSRFSNLECIFNETTYN